MPNRNADKKSDHHTKSLNNSAEKKALKETRIKFSNKKVIPTINTVNFKSVHTIYDEITHGQTPIQKDRESDQKDLTRGLMIISKFSKQYNVRKFNLRESSSLSLESIEFMTSAIHSPCATGGIQLE